MRFGLQYQFSVRAGKAIAVIGLLSTFIILLIVYSIDWWTLRQASLSIVGLGYVGSSITSMLLSCGIRWHWLRNCYKAYDAVIAAFLMGIVGLFSMLVIPSAVQTRLMFHNVRHLHHCHHHDEWHPN
jgi:hypothetical protein